MHPHPQLYTGPNLSLPTTPLDPHETTVDVDHPDPNPIHPGHGDHSTSVTLRSHDLRLTGSAAALRSSTAFRHSGWAPIRRRVWQALKDTGVPQQRLERFEACGNRAWVVSPSDDPRRFKIIGNYCRDRFCTPCATARSHFIADQLYDVIRDERIRFVTLTIKTGDASLTHYLDKLRASFRRLRQTKLWKNCVRDGVSMQEIKWNTDTHRWHPHLHLLVTGRYIPVQALRNAWKKATGDSFVVDVQCLRNSMDGARYVSKYATKAIDNATLRNPTRLREAIHALHGKRTFLLFGAWRKVSMKPPSMSGNWEYVVTLDKLCSLLSVRNDYAIQVFHCLITGARLDKRYSLPNAAPKPRPPPEHRNNPHRVTPTQPSLLNVSPTGHRV